MERIVKSSDPYNLYINQNSQKDWVSKIGKQFHSCWSKFRICKFVYKNAKNINTIYIAFQDHFISEVSKVIN